MRPYGLKGNAIVDKHKLPAVAKDVSKKAARQAGRNDIVSRTMIDLPPNSSGWTFRQIMPPGARGAFQPWMYAKDGWIAEEKLDGDRRIAQFCPDKVRFTGRRISEVNGLLVEKTDCLPHLSPAVSELEGTVLDGEMTVPWQGGRSRDVTSIIGSKPELAIAKQKDRGWLRYVVFDCLFYKGQDLRQQPLSVRREVLARVLKEWNNEHVVMVPSALHDREQFLMGIWESRGEGVILKDLGSKYGNEKAWVKVKREFTEDVVVIGYDAPEEMTEKIETVVEDGMKKRKVLEVSRSRLAEAGWIGAIRFGQFLKVPTDYVIDTKVGDMEVPVVWLKDGKLILRYCGSCSGMDDAMRKEFSENKEKYIGTVVEILANEREPSGKFRHPRMVGLRPDKNAQDCIVGQR